MPALYMEGREPIYGPVITPAPTGERAVRLGEMVCGWSEFPRLYELRTPKRAGDYEHISQEFEPYLAARRWRSVQNPVA